MENNNNTFNSILELENLAREKEHFQRFERNDVGDIVGVWCAGRYFCKQEVQEIPTYTRRLFCLRELQ